MKAIVFLLVMAVGQVLAAPMRSVGNLGHRSHDARGMFGSRGHDRHGLGYDRDLHRRDRRHWYPGRFESYNDFSTGLELYGGDYGSGRYIRPPMPTLWSQTVPYCFSETPEEPDTPLLIAEVQMALARQGNYTGPIDGIPGPNTLRAIAEFQVTHSLPVTGKIDMVLKSQLGLL